MKIELFDVYVDREFGQWWMVIGCFCFYQCGNISLLSIQKDPHRWIIEVLFIRWDLLYRKLFP